jgi:hypothetical protein
MTGTGRYTLLGALCCFGALGQSGSSTPAPTSIPNTLAPETLIGMSMWHGILVLTVVAVAVLGILMLLLNKVLERCRMDARRLEKGVEDGELLMQKEVVEREEVQITHLAALHEPITIPNDLLQIRRERVPDTPEFLRSNFFVSREAPNDPKVLSVRKTLALSAASKTTKKQTRDTSTVSDKSSTIEEFADCDHSPLDPEEAKRITQWIRRTSNAQNVDEFPASSFVRVRDDSEGLPADPFQDIRRVQDTLSEKSSEEASR